MGVLAMFLYVGSIFTSLLITFSAATGVKDDHMFVYHDVSIVESGTTFDSNAKSRLVCASLCMQNEDCVALSYQNRTCRIETSSNLTTIQNVGSVTMTYSKGSVLQHDFAAANTSSNPTSSLAKDGTTHADITSTETITNDSQLTMTVFESAPVFNSTIGTTTTGREAMSPLSTDATPRDPVITDQSTTDPATRDHVAITTLSTEATTRDFAITRQPTIDPKQYQTTKSVSIPSVYQQQTSNNTYSWSNLTSNYFFISMELSMFEAQAFCNETGGRLLEIQTPEKEQFLKDNILHLSSSSFYWIGAYDYTKDGNYKWQSHPEEAMAYTNWNNVREPRRIGANTCLYSYSGWGYSWGSAGCTDTNSFFCEKMQ